MTFPIINHLDELRAQVGHQPEIGFITNEFGFTIVSYIISTGETFTGENKDWARECRGITFDKKGNIHSRPLHKFFNIGELPETQMNFVEMLMKNGHVIRVMDKRDGSMVHPVRVHGKIYLKTKKSFTSDAANLATAFMEYALPKHVTFCHACIEEGVTPIFEFTSPKNHIVLPYSHDGLHLLHIRDNVTGQYVADPAGFAKSMGFEIPTGAEYPTAEIGPAQILESMEKDEDKEGYVIQFQDGTMVKGKTQWYLQLHRTIVFVRERDVAEMVVNETVDDYKSYVYSAPESEATMKKVEAIEHRVLQTIRQIELDIEKAEQEIAGMTDRKEIAMKMKGHKWFSAVMNRFNGKEFDVRDYFLKNHLKQDFSLEQI